MLRANGIFGDDEIRCAVREMMNSGVGSGELELELSREGRVDDSERIATGEWGTAWSRW